MKQPIEVATQLFVSTDQQNWEGVKESFHSSVNLDYSSMTGSPAAELTPDQIIEAWKGVLPGFEHTHHQLGNFLADEGEGKASVFCYGTASHYLEDANGNIWTVVGTYNFDLIQNEQNEWKITSMTFHFKYQDGNTALPEKAISLVK